MKKFLFSLMAIVLVSVNTNAQKKNYSKEEVRVELAKGMVSFTKSVEPVFNTNNSSFSLIKIKTTK